MSDASNDPDPVEMKVDPSVTDSLKNPGDTNSFGSPNSEEDAPVTADLISNAEPNRVEQSTASKPQLQFGSPDHQGLGGTNQDTHRWWSPVVMVFISLAAFLRSLDISIGAESSFNDENTLISLANFIKYYTS